MMTQAARIKNMHIEGIDIVVTFKNVKNLTMYVKPPAGDVFMTVPLRTKDSYIESFVYKRKEWIAKTKVKIIERSEANDKDGLRSGVVITNTEKQKLAVLVEKYATYWEPILGVHCNRWTLRSMKTLWGSCSVKKETIRINTMLARRPEECVELIVVHELTHLLEPSHNKVFKAYMTKFIPDWKEREKLL